MRRFENNSRKPSAFDVAAKRVVSQTLAKINTPSFMTAEAYFREFLAANPEVGAPNTRRIPLPILSNRFNFEQIS